MSLVDPAAAGEGVDARRVDRAVRAEVEVGQVLRAGEARFVDPAGGSELFPLVALSQQQLRQERPVGRPRTATRSPLDVVPGRSGTAYAGWLKDQSNTFTTGIKHACLDPFRGYANAIRDELPDAVAVLDAFHVVKLGTQVVDEVRRRVQQDTLDRGGHRDDPLYKIRGLLRRGRGHLSDTQIVKLNTCLIAGDPGFG